MSSRFIAKILQPNFLRAFSLRQLQIYSTHQQTTSEAQQEMQHGDDSHRPDSGGGDQPFGARRFASSSTNEVLLIGNVGNDPRVRSTDDGRSSCTFSLATHETLMGPQGRTENVEWHRITCRGGLAQRVLSEVNKGSQVFVQGRIKSRRMQNESGETFSHVFIRAKRVNLLRPGRGGFGGGGGGAASFGDNEKHLDEEADERGEHEEGGEEHLVDEASKK